MHRNTLAGKRVARVMRHGALGGVTGRPWNRIRQGTHQMAAVPSPIPCQEVREGAKKFVPAAGSAPKLMTLILIVAPQRPPLPVVAGELRPPDPRGSLAKGDRRAHGRGRGPRPHCPQRLSHRTQGRVPAQAQRAVAVERRLRLRERLPCRATLHRSGSVLWSCGRALRASPRPAGRVDKPWTRLAPRPPR